MNEAHDSVGDGSADASGPREAATRATGDRARWGPTVGEEFLPEHSFALCLTHDVDRPYKRVQAVYYALCEHDPGHLRALLPGHNPNWQFERVMATEQELGVRSAFYFLDEQRLLADRPARDLLDPGKWRLYADRYDVTERAIANVVRDLDACGWEVGLHGSYESYDDPERLGAEKDRLEAVLGHPVLGGRHHYLNRRLPETWEHHVSLGLRYDATLGSATEYGFDYGDTVFRPFGDEFVVFPLTIMDVALPDPDDRPRAAWRACESVLERAADRGAIATVLWHPRFFNEDDWPGYGNLYRRLVERALDLGAWVGPPGELYRRLEHWRDGGEVPPVDSGAWGDSVPGADEEASVRAEAVAGFERTMEVGGEAGDD